MAISIGPRIGIEGATEFKRQIKTLTSEFKMFEAEIKKAGASFEKNGDLLGLNERKTELLKKQMRSLNEIIANQSVQLHELQRKNGDQSKWTEEQKQKYNELHTAISKNMTEYTKLEVELDNVTKETQEYVEMNKLLNTMLEVQPTKIEKISSNLKAYGDEMIKVGRKMTMFLTVPIAGFLGSTVKTAADWETGFTGVLKTVDLVDKETGKLIMTEEELEQSLIDVAKATVLPYEELLQVGEVAGQLGISADKVAEFSNVMLMLGASTTMTSEEAATNIAKILNITNKGLPYSIDMVERFGNTLVELGNNFATTEGDITLMATRLASAGTVAGLSTAEILALSTAMSAVGIRAEAGGSAMAQTLVNLEKKVAEFKDKGGDSLDLVAKLAGTTAEEFADAWENRPAEAIMEFIRGLGSLEEEAESTSIILSELDMDGIRQANMLKALSKAYPQLEDALKKANNEWERGNALFTEYDKRSKDYNARVQNLKNNFAMLKRELGEKLLPVLEKWVETGKQIVNWLEGLPDGVQEAVIAIGIFVAALGPLIMMGGGIAKGLGNILDLVSRLGTAKGAGALASSLSSIGTSASDGVSGVNALKTSLTGTGGLTDSIATTTAAVGKTGGGGLLGALGLTGASLVTGVVIPIITALGVLNAAFDENGKVTKEWIEETDKILKTYGGDYDTWGQETIVAYDEYGNAIVQKATEYADRQMKEYQIANETITMSTKQMKLNNAMLYDDLGNELVARTQTMNAEMELENERHYQVVDTAVKGYKTSTIQDYEETEQGMIAKIEEYRQPLVDATQQSMDEAKKPVEALKEQSPGWGSDFVQGFIDGISAMYDKVSTAAKGIADRIASWVHFTKPDKGPLREYEQWMPHFMQGLANGINANAWRVEDAMSGLTSDMSIGVDAPTKGLSNSYNYGGIVINLNAPEGANGQQLVDEIEREIVNRTMRRRAVFGQ